MKTTLISILVILAFVGAAVAHGNGKKVCHRHGPQTTHCHR